MENLARFRSVGELEASGFFMRNREAILTFLRTPQVSACAGSIPRLGDFLRVAQWNIEKGKRLDPIAECFGGHAILQWADIIILNEADCGMSRSGNRHVAAELAGRLGMHMVFAPAHFELTDGSGDDLPVAGENRESLQGNAILSRHPVREASVVALPVTFEPYEFGEKRFGRRSCLWARVEWRRSRLWVGSVHLELRNTPSCRARQVEHIMKNLHGGGGDAYLLGGDLNTNGFSRGTLWRTVRSAARLLCLPAGRIRAELLSPDRGREPLFEVAGRHGFFWDALNTNEETARTAIDDLEESDALPGFLLGGIRRRLRPYGGYLSFKLDWLLGRRLKALAAMERCDARTGVMSVGPGRVPGINHGPGRMSDHLPVYADLALE